MNSQINFKASFLSETFATLCAGERTLSSVNLLVDFKASFSTETFSHCWQMKELLIPVF